MRPAPSSSPQNGFVLLSVLVVTAVISALTIAAAIVTRAHVRSTDTEVGTIEARALADAGIARIRASIERQDDPLLISLLEAPSVSWRYADTDLQLGLIREAGKVDLNSGQPELVRNVMLAAVKDRAQAERLLTRWADFRRNGRIIETTEALLDPAERFDEIAVILEQIFTTLSGARGIDPLAASDLILRQVPGMTEADLLALTNARQTQKTGAELSAIKTRFSPLLDGERPIYRLRASVLRANTKIEREALVLHDAAMGRVRIILWRDVLRKSIRPAAD
ncbi:hypothetical protein AB4Y85_17520 [Microvirga sp. 2YAF29]|uniref:hypothetical protein n=1 Tax=Microvirga sp. 2YAF29 TaxID=3233031 RepID=UPI003F987F3D